MRAEAVKQNSPPLRDSHSSVREKKEDMAEQQAAMKPIAFNFARLSQQPANLTIQPKLSINHPGDGYEQEADAMAEKVMRSAGSMEIAPVSTSISMLQRCAACDKEEEEKPEKIQRKCSVCGGKGEDDDKEGQVQRKCSKCEEEEKKELQRKESTAQTPKLSAAVSHTLRQAGKPLDAATRIFMEQRFGFDFGRVRIHDNTSAHVSAKDIHAKAYTHENNIVFAAGQYQPQSYEGKKLLAHELTHVVQQSSGKIARKKETIQRKEERPQPIVESKDIAKQGKQTTIKRIITPGECKITSDSSSSATAGRKGNKLMFEAKGCKNNATGEAYGDLDFGEFVDGADNFMKALPSILSSGTSSALNKAIDTSFRDAHLKASLKLSFRINHLRVEVSGTGAANLNQNYEAGVEGFIRYANGKFNIELGGGFKESWDKAQASGGVTSFHLYTDIGPIIIRVDGKHQDSQTTIEGYIGNTDISKNVGVGVKYDDGAFLLTWTFQLPEKMKTEKAPECVTCGCETPQIDFRCTDHEDTPETPPRKKLEPQVISLYYAYETAEPRADKDFPAGQYARTIESVIERIKEGYTVDRIEGFTSPEGSLKEKKGKFEGNEKLSLQRAEKARDGIKKAISDANSLLAMRNTAEMQENLSAAAGKTISAIGMNEVHGTDGSNADVKEARLFDHLSKELKAPVAGEEDILDKEFIKGNTLPEELRESADTAIASFRTGKAGKTTLTKKQRLDRLYPWLRKALVFLNPPRPKLKTQIPLADLMKLAGTDVPCTEDDKKVFDNVPMPANDKLFVDHCSTDKK